MRILFVWPGAEFSVWDVGRGLRNALAAAGHDVRDYYLTRRMVYHGHAMEAGGVAPSKENVAHIAKQASETVVVEALYHDADLVVLCCGLNFHPLGLRLLEQVRIPMAIVLTESPYEDADQAEFVAHAPSATVCTNDAGSAARHGWTYLPAAFDPAIHRPVGPDPAEACDVLMIGTGWAERQRLFEAVDWTGIRPRFIGTWPYMADGSPVRCYTEEMCVPNEQAPRYYASAKIVLNLHRAHPDAVSLNPRAYEAAACGAFVLSDARAEGATVFGDAFATFDGTAADLERQIRAWLSRDEARQARAERQQAAVQGQTFDARAARLLHATGQLVGR